jgi:hypothetical protein
MIRKHRPAQDPADSPDELTLNEAVGPSTEDDRDFFHGHVQRRQVDLRDQTLAVANQDHVFAAGTPSGRRPGGDQVISHGRADELNPRVTE